MNSIQKGNPLGYEKLPKLLKSFAVPSIIAMLVSSLYNIVDQVFIGQGIGYLGNAATNVAFPLTTISLAIALLIGGGLGYFISYETGSFVAQCINFPLQRNITFKSHGNPVYQAMWYFIAWILISLICNGFNNLWMPIASAWVPPAIYNILVTFVTGGVSMVIFFFVFKIIFPEGEAKK